MDVDQIYQRMGDDTEIVTKDPNDSQVSKAYKGKTIFVTGATGFLGKPLMEKFLRCCPEIEKIYLLLRPKKSKTVKERMEHFFNHHIFNNLRSTRPDFSSKVEAIKGDLSRKRLGMSEEDYAKLTNELDIIYHNGCEVRFNIPLAIILKINVLGTKEILDLAMQCPKLKAFVYVSSAYSHSHQLDIKEELYPAPGDLKMVEDIVAAHEENKAGLHEDAVKGIIGKWPNSYTFTKAVAEDFVRQYAAKASFKVAIFRPSMVFGCYREPAPGWLGNYNGPIMMYLLIALGLIRILWHTYHPVDYIPVDMCSNMGIVIIWDMITNKKADKEVSVYNFGTTVANPKRHDEMYAIAKPVFRREPTERSIWYPDLIVTTSIPLAIVGNIFMHIIPLLLYGLFCIVTLRWPYQAIKLYHIAQFFIENARFLLYAYKIDVTKSLELCDKMADVDKDIFFCDIRQLDWEKYIETLIRGFRVYGFKEDLSDLEKGRKKHERLFVMHLMLQGFLLLLATYLLRGYIFAVFNFFSS